MLLIKLNEKGETMTLFYAFQKQNNNNPFLLVWWAQWTLVCCVKPEKNSNEKNEIHLSQKLINMFFGKQTTDEQTQFAVYFLSLYKFNNIVFDQISYLLKSCLYNHHIMAIKRCCSYSFSCCSDNIQQQQLTNLLNKTDSSR